MVELRKFLRIVRKMGMKKSCIKGHYFETGNCKGCSISLEEILSVKGVVK
jgi:hypothetical protein